MPAFFAPDDSVQWPPTLLPSLPMLPPETSVQAAATLMQRQACRCLWIVQQENYLGCFTEQSLLEAVASGRDLSQSSIGEFIQPLEAVANALLLDSNLSFAALFEQTSVGICLGQVNGRIIRANPGLSRLVGYSQAELAAKTFAEITHPEDLADDLRLTQQLIAGDFSSFSLEKRYLHKAGHSVWVSLTVCLVRDASGRPLFTAGISQAIGDRKAAELALRHSQERYALAIGESHMGVWDWDLLTDHIYISPNLKALLGYSDKDIANHIDCWSSLVYPADRPLVHQAIQAHLAGHAAEFKVTHRMLHKDGSIRWILARGRAFRDAAGRPLRMAGTDTDITDLKYTEEALVQSHRQIANILESITDGFVALDREWRFTYVNQQAEQQLQSSREQLLGQTFWQMYPAIQHAPVGSYYRQAMEARLSQVFESYCEQSQRWLEIHAYPAAEGIVLYLQDISDRKRNEAERKRTYEQLQRQIRREQGLNRVLQAIRMTLDLDTIFSTATAEMASLLPIEQALICLYQPQPRCWHVAAEYRQNSAIAASCNTVVADPEETLLTLLAPPAGVHLTPAEAIAQPVLKQLVGPQPGSCLLLPLQGRDDRPWGALLLLHSQHQRRWLTSEIELVRTVADQLAIAVQQANTLEQARRDLAKRQQAEARLKEAQRISHTGDWEWDLSTHTITWSEEMFRICGLPGQTVPPRRSKIWAMVLPADRRSLLLLLLQAIKTGAAYSLELQLQPPDGSRRYVQLLGQSRRNSTEQVSQLVGTLIDISARKQIEEQLVYEALHDALTGAPNRAYFMDQLNRAIVQVNQEPSYTFAVLFIDLDRFKVINDSLGHLIGDQLLIECTHRLQAVVRSDDLIARIGGDEFAVLLNAIADIQEAIWVAERIHEVMRRPFDLNGREIFISASVGISSNLTGAVAAVDFLRDADTAMYQAKGQGRGRSALFNPSMYEQVNRQLTLENDLRRALERQELELHYQPIFDLHQQRLVGFEALVRWHHPRWGCILPSTFIPLAEETGLILPIGTWTLQTACQQLQQWQQLPFAAGLVIGVNLSVKQFANPYLIADIDAVLTSTGLKSAQLRLEITETALIDNLETAEAILTAIEARGIQLCIDDFGTGYSSLSVVHRFPVHILKIDRSFISRIEADERGLAMVQAILALAHSLGMTAIAEGIETASQLARLQELACPYGQGYWFAMPLGAAEAAALIARAAP